MVSGREGATEHYAPRAAEDLYDLSMRSTIGPISPKYCRVARMLPVLKSMSVGKPMLR